MFTFRELQTLLQNNYVTKTGAFNGKKRMPPDVSEALKTVTAFLDYDAPAVTRATYVLGGITEQCKCKQCGVPLRFTTSVAMSPSFCSLKCSNGNKDTKALRRQTNIDKYGVDNPFRDAAKIKSAVLAKHGVENISHLAEVKALISEKNTLNADRRMASARSTNQEKYGTDWAVASATVRDKIKRANLRNYGAETVFALPEVQQKIKESHIAKYGSLPCQTDEVKQKIAQTKLERHGDAKFNNRDKAKETSLDRYGCDPSRKDWSDLARSLLDDAEELSKYAAGKPVQSMAMELGISPTALRSALTKHDIMTYDMRNNQYETLIAELLDSLGVAYIRSDRSVLQGKELDFLIPSCNIAIECNGIYWHSELAGKTRSYHLDKTVKCAENGIRLVHLWDYQMDTKWEVVKSIITNLVKQTGVRIGARKTELKQITSAECAAFLEQNHLQGKVNCGVRLGLFYNGELVSVMGFGKSRFKENEYELLRFANKIGYSVPGAASKLLTHFVDNFQVGSLISYANRDISAGAVYGKIGFVETGVTPPSYFYFKGRTVYNRLQFQKHKLPTLLESYDPALSEWQNMQNNGFNRCWNTGNIKYEYRK